MGVDARRAGILVAAVLGTAVVAAVPVGGLSTAGQYAIATTFFAAVLWVTGAVPLPVTAVTVPVVLTAFGVYDDMARALTGFADPVIFLLLAGFSLAAALQAHGIDRRVAYLILLRVGTSPRRLILAVMVATAVLSMVISNTATVAMMVPVSLGLVGQVTDVYTVEEAADDAVEAANTQVAILLGIAYAASLGGVGTLVGTPPNAIVVGQLDLLIDVEITFVDWLFVGLPMVVVTLPVAWLLLTYWAFPPGVTDVSAARDRARRELDAADDLSSGGKWAVGIFAVTATLWVIGGLGFLFEPYLPAAVHTTLFGGPGAHVFGTGGHEGLFFYVLVGLAAVPALVVSGAVEFDDLVADVDWGTLLLLGGGLSLADALRATDATRWLADVTFGSLTGASVLVVLAVLIAGVILVGELASNTAMAAILAPLLVDVGPQYAAELGIGGTQAATFLAISGAVAASYGFALPVATPPNAIVYGTGYVSREDMLRAGVVLDVVVVLLATVVLWLLIQFLWPVVL